VDKGSLMISCTIGGHILCNFDEKNESTSRTQAVLVGFTKRKGRKPPIELVQLSCGCLASLSESDLKTCSSYSDGSKAGHCAVALGSLLSRAVDRPKPVCL
jgi:hypothetical protein